MVAPRPIRLPFARSPGATLRSAPVGKTADPMPTPPSSDLSRAGHTTPVRFSRFPRKGDPRQSPVRGIRPLARTKLSAGRQIRRPAVLSRSRPPREPRGGRRAGPRGDLHARRVHRRGVAGPRDPRRAPRPHAAGRQGGPGTQTPTRWRASSSAGRGRGLSGSAGRRPGGRFASEAPAGASGSWRSGARVARWAKKYFGLGKRLLSPKALLRRASFELWPQRAGIRDVAV